MSCMNVSVHDLHHCTKLQLGINFQNFRVGKVLGLGFAQ